MGYRKTSNEIILNEKYERAWKEYLLNSQKWETANRWITRFAADEWESWWDDSFGEADDELTKKLLMLMAYKGVTEEQLRGELAEYDKMRQRGWCHKAEEKYQDVRMRQEEIKGYELAMSVLKGEAQLGPEPLVPQIEETRSTKVENGLLFEYLVMGVIILVSYALLNLICWIF